jgi:hypothetical protein
LDIKAQADACAIFYWYVSLCSTRPRSAKIFEIQSMSKKPNKPKTLKRVKNTGSQSAKSKEISFILPFTEQELPTNLTHYFNQTKSPLKLIVVSNSELEVEGNNIQFVKTNATELSEQWKEGLAKVENQDSLVSLLYPNQHGNILGVAKWFSKNKPQANSETAWVGVQGKAGKLNNVVQRFWNPLNVEKPLADINVVSPNLANEIAAQYLPIPIQQARFITENEQVGVEFMELETETTHSFAKEKINLIKLQHQLFFQDFIKTPIRSLKNKQDLKSKLKFGNHPIYKLIFLAIFSLFALVTPFLSFDYGITWDEQVNVIYAEDAWEYFSSFGENKIVLDEKARHARNATKFYGTSFDLTAFLLNKISPFGIFETRHLLNLLVGLLTVLFIGRATALFRDWRTACFAIVLAFLCPRYFGHMFNNHKDIPFMLGMAVSTFYLLKFLKELPKPKLSTALWLAIGMAIAISIRVGGLILFGYFGLFFGLAWLGILAKKGAGMSLKLLPKYLAYGVGICIIAYFLGIALWPYGLQAPLSNPLKALTQFSNFQFLLSYELFEGERMLVTQPPWNYIPKWLFISLPLVVLVGFFISFFGNVQANFKRYFFVILLFMLVFPIAYIIYKGSTVYSGWRQVLFVFIPIAMLAATGWDFLIQACKPKILKGFAIASFVALLALPAYWMVKNHPNQYVYFNELAGGIDGAYGNHETEYWGNSAKQAIEWMAENGKFDTDKEKIVIATNLEVQSSQYYANKYSDKVQILWRREVQKYHADWDYAIFASRTLSKKTLEKTFPPKGTIHSIKADNTPLVAIIESGSKAMVESITAQKARNLPLALQKVEEYLAYDSLNVEALRQRAVLLLNGRKYSETIVAADRVIELSPDDYSAYVFKGIALTRLKKHKEAIVALDKSTDLRINNTGGYQHKGVAYGQLKDYTTAYKNFDLAVKYSAGKNANVYLNMAQTIMKHGMEDEKIKKNRMQTAINILQRVLKLSPNNKQAYRGLAFAHNQLGNTDAAKKFQQLSR